jgi:hypothetical protein
MAMDKHSKAILSDAGKLFDKLTDANLMRRHLDDAPKQADGLDLHSLWQATEGKASDTQMQKISQNFMARKQFKAILDTTAMAYQPRQAAASSASDYRHGSAFDIRIKPSAAQDGLVYVQLLFHQKMQLDQDQPSVLVSYRDGIYRQKPLTSIKDQRIQLLWHSDDPMLKDLRDPETELYIK